MRFEKRLCALLLAVVLLLVSVPVVSAADGTIVMNLGSNVMTVNGGTVAIDTDPAIKPQVQTVNGFGYTMLPLRAVVESIGGTVAYDAATKNITMTYNGTTMTHVIGTATAYVNGVSQPLAITSYAANNRTYVHLRAIELLSPSITVTWEQSAPDRVEITYPQNGMSAPPVLILPDAPVILDPNVSSGELSLTVYNEMDDVKLEELCLAPEGTGDYGENLLERALNPGTKWELTLTIVPGEYDLLGVDDDGEEYEWEGLELEEAELYLWLIEDDEYELTDDEDYEYESEAEKPHPDEVKLTVLNQSQGTIKELEIYTEEDDPESIYLRSESLALNDAAVIELEDLETEKIRIYARYDGLTVVYGPIPLRDESMLITLQPYGKYASQSYEDDGAVRFRNESGKTITDLRVDLEGGRLNDAFSENLLDAALKDGKTVELKGYSCLQLCGELIDVQFTFDGGNTYTKTVSIDEALADSLLLGIDRNHDIRVVSKNDEDAEYQEGLYLLNASNDDFDEFYVLIWEMVDADEDDYDYHFSRSDIEAFFEEHPADDPDEHMDYEPDDYYVRVKNLNEGETAYVDEWTADDLEDSLLLFKGVVEDEVFYGDCNVSVTDEFTYNLLISVNINGRDEIRGDVIETDLTE